MTLLVPLILALVAMAAAIAYTGDWLGSVVGKRRLSLFGARPRQTGRIIGVLAGVLIMLVTLGTLALVFRNAVRVIFNAQAAAEQLSVAQAQVRNLESQRNALSGDLQEALDTIASAQEETQRAQEQRDQAEADLERLQGLQQDLERSIDEVRAQLERSQQELADAETVREAAVRERDQAEGELAVVRTELDELQAEVETLQTQAQELSDQNASLTEMNDELLRDNVQLSEANDALSAQIAERNAQLGQLASEVERLMLQLEESVQQLDEAQYLLDAVRDGDLTYSRLELVATGVLSAQDTATVRAELVELLEAANEQTALRGAGPVELMPNQLESLLESALETPGPDVVTLRSADNHSGTEPIRVQVEASENRQLVSEGQLVTSRQIHLGSRQAPADREQVRTLLLRLQRDARDRLLGMGLSDAVNPELAAESLDVDSFANQLLRLSGPVAVGLSASRDIYGSGPAPLEFVIIN